MASFKLNIARLRGCPDPQEVDKAMAEWGLPDDDAYGVLDHSVAGEAAYATIVRKTQQTIQCVDAEAKEMTATIVERAAAIPFGVRPSKEILEVYAGSASAIEQVGLFFSSCLAMPVTAEPIDLDVGSAIDKLRSLTERCELRAARVKDYAHNSFMSGTYAPKFLDTEHGRDFLEEYGEHIAAASVRFTGQNGRINVSLSSKSCFGFSCDEEDQPLAQSILRKLV